MVKSLSNSRASLSVRPTTLGTVIKEVSPGRSRKEPIARAMTATMAAIATFLRGILVTGNWVVISSPRESFKRSFCIIAAL
ncbi:unannotated protein [freshwater metagenome]|uniref:Unannotated protein n=1 Tax=freshwater metagenome TaxID=449393 RepID=A0A6J6E9T9_9ZZZZ